MNLIWNGIYYRAGTIDSKNFAEQKPQQLVKWKVYIFNIHTVVTLPTLIIIMFCYSPKHCFRLFEEQQSASWRINFSRFRCGERIRTHDSQTGGQGANQITTLTPVLKYNFILVLNGFKLHLIKLFWIKWRFGIEGF